MNTQCLKLQLSLAVYYDVMRAASAHVNKEGCHSVAAVRDQFADVALGVATFVEVVGVTRVVAADTIVYYLDQTANNVFES